MPKPRKELLREAEASGWETVNRTHSKISVLVAADPDGESAKLCYAREKGIPILTFADWAALTTDGELTQSHTNKTSVEFA
jgi:NAD-dependent DNA ligase